VFSTLGELLDRARPELVVVATPPDLHAELAIQALEAGAHVFCEKPFATSVAEADRVLAAAEPSRRVAVNHHMREMPIFKALRSRIEGGEDGGLVFLQIWQLVDLAPWLDPRSWCAARPDLTLLEAGIHAIDLMLFLLGESPLAVTAHAAGGLDGPEGADAIWVVTLELPRGRLAQLTASTLCPAAARHLEVRADCERASLRASMGGRVVVKIGKKRAQRAGIHLELGAGGTAWAERGLARRTLARNPRIPQVHATRVLLTRLIDALERGQQPPSSGFSARQTLAVVEAAYRSAQTRTRVPLAD
jgi:predicted dehydrogenase